MPDAPPPRTRPSMRSAPPVPGRRKDSRSAALDTVRALFWLLTLGVIVAFLFFAFVGQVNVLEALVPTLVVLGLAVLWIVHAILDRRHAEEHAHDPRIRQSRERRGF